MNNPARPTLNTSKIMAMTLPIAVEGGLSRPLNKRTQTPQSAPGQVANSDSGSTSLAQKE